MNGLAGLRVTLRTLARSKGFVAAGAITLGLGIAATSTIFSVVYGVLLRPLPYSDPFALVRIEGEKDFSTGPRIMNFSAPEIEEFASATTAFSAIASSAATGYTIRDEAGVQSISAAIVSGDFFRTLGTSPLIGRWLTDEAEPNAVISERLWRQHFGGSVDVLGEALTLTDREFVSRAFTVIGVMPREFQYPRARTDVWRPLRYERSTGDKQILNRNAGGHFFIARLRPGLSVPDAQRDAERANEGLLPTYGGGRVGMRAKLTPLSTYVTGNSGSALWALLAAVGLVLLVACANVASLILARQVSRSRELSVRLALGAPRIRLLGHVMVESGAIAALGCALGLAATAGAIGALQWIQPAGIPRLDAIDVDGPVLAFAAGAALLASLAAGLGPAWLGTRADAAAALRTGTRTPGSGFTRRVRNLLVIVEVAAAIVLLVGATLMARTLAALLDTDVGVNRQNIVAARLDLGLGRSVSGPRQVEIAEALRARVADIPSVREAGFGTGLPPAGEYLRLSFVLANEQPGEPTSHMVTGVPVGPGFFEALQIPLLSGRRFNDHDAAGQARTVIVSREAARRFFGEADPIGRTLPLGGETMTVVGVAGDVKFTGITAPPEGVIYLPFGQSPFRIVILVARADGDLALVAREMRQVIRTYDPDISIAGLQPLTSWISDAVAESRFRALLLWTIAGVTLILAMVGLYGVVAYTTTLRTPEIGVRMAIGAGRSDVIGLVVRDGARLALAGTVVGAIAGYAVSSVLSGFVYGVTPTDPVSFGMAAAGLIVVSLAASYLPARRAARIDPAVALRAE
jgi:putative ABC transport system permease protein